MKYVLAILALAISTQAIAAFEETEGDGCLLSESYEGDEPTELFIAQRQDDFDAGDKVVIGVFNQGWSIAPGDSLGDIRVTGSDGTWFENEGIAGEHGFIMYVQFEHADDVLNTGKFIITRGGQLVDKLKTSGFLLDDWFSFQMCREERVRDKRERDHQEAIKKEIPTDPFAD